MLRRSGSPITYTFPDDWSSEEKERWLAVWNQVRKAREDWKKVVFVSGVFDLFHQEHQKFLEKARQAGNFLVAGIESDARVRVIKGPDRPNDSQDVRLAAVLDSGVVDAAAILPENFDRPEHHRALIELLRPNILAVSTHSPHQEGKRAIIESVGGKLVQVLEHNPQVSTTKTLQTRTMDKS